MISIMELHHVITFPFIFTRLNFMFYFIKLTFLKFRLIIYIITFFKQRKNKTKLNIVLQKKYMYSMCIFFWDNTMKKKAQIELFGRTFSNFFNKLNLQNCIFNKSKPKILINRNVITMSGVYCDVYSYYYGSYCYNYQT
jgi:hypothetical protein